MAPAVTVKAPKIDVSLIASLVLLVLDAVSSVTVDVVGGRAGDVDDLARAGLGRSC